MPLKPAHIQAAGPKNDRQAIWEVIRSFGRSNMPFTNDAVCRILPDETPLEKVQAYMRCLEKGGYIEQKVIGHKTGKIGVRNVYLLKNDVGIDAPRLTKKGQPVDEGRGHEQMWRVIKILSVFNARDLAIAASTEECRVKESTAKEYVRYLKLAGYLVQLTQPVKKRGGQATYRLLPSKNTGPKPPMIQRVKQVFDQNTAEIVWPKGGKK